MLFRSVAAGGEYVGVEQHGMMAAHAVMYPSPASQKVFLDFTLKNPLPADYEILDLTGKVVFRSGQKWLDAGKNKIEIPVTNFKNGLYFVRLTAKGQPVLTSRFVVVK